MLFLFCNDRIESSPKIYDTYFLRSLQIVFTIAVVINKLSYTLNNWHPVAKLIFKLLYSYCFREPNSECKIFDDYFSWKSMFCYVSKISNKCYNSSKHCSIYAEKERWIYTGSEINGYLLWMWIENYVFFT